MKKAPTRAAPHPPTPPTPPGSIRAYKLRQQPVESPGRVDCPGSFSVAVNAQTDIFLICCSKVTVAGKIFRTACPTRVRPFPDFESVWGDYERRWSGMLTRFLAGRTFEPNQIVVMSAAFADTCKALGLSEADHPLLPLVARHVMGLGQRGVKTRGAIYLLTLEEFRPCRQ